MASYSQILCANPIPRFSEGLHLLNSIDSNQFTTLIKEIFLEDIVEPDNIPESLTNFNLSSENVDLILNTVRYLKTRIAKYIMKPKDLQVILTRELHLSEDKAESLIKVWSQKPNQVLNSINGKHLDGTSWILCAEISDNNRLKDKPEARGKLQLILSDEQSNVREKINLNMAHPQLSEVYSQLEAIQQELDNARK